MTVRSLFIIILKVLGLFFLRDFIAILPQFLSLFSMFANMGTDMVSPLIAVILSIAAYGYIAYVLILKTEWLIDKFDLDKGFEVDAIRLNIHRSTVLSITVIIVGALIFINALPPLIKYVVQYFQYSRSSALFSAEKPDWPYIFMYACQIIIGLLFTGNHRHIVNFIERRRMKSYEDENPE